MKVKQNLYAKLWITGFIITSVLQIFFRDVAAEKHIVAIDTSSPTMKDTPLWMKATLYPYRSGNYTYKWSDDGINRHKSFTDKNRGSISEWNVIYGDEDLAEDRRYYRTISVTVYEYVTIFNYPLEIAANSTKIRLTDNLNGHMSFSQPNATSTSDEGYISTSKATNITITINDLHDWIKNRTTMVSFYWQISEMHNRKNVTFIGPCSTPSLLINFTNPGEYMINSNIVLVLSDGPITTTTTSTTSTTTTTSTTSTTTTTTTTSSTTSTTTSSTTSTTTKKPDVLKQNSIGEVDASEVDLAGSLKAPNNYRCDGWWPKGGTVPPIISSNPIEQPMFFDRDHVPKYGWFSNVIEALDPISNFNITGPTWLKHGQLLKLKVNCHGSGPFNYCFNVTRGAFNTSDPIICNKDSIKTNVCGFEIHRYLQNVDTFSISIKIHSPITTIIKRTSVIIYNVDRRPPIATVIVPVTVVVAVMIMIVFGVAHVIQSHYRYNVEVADFDFLSEGAERRSIYQELKDALFDAFSADLSSAYSRGRSTVEGVSILDDD